MNAVEIEQAISELAEETYDSEEFPFQFLVAFGNKEPTIKKLRKGDSNKSDIPNGILQRNNIHIATCLAGEVAKTLNALKSSPANAKGKVKFILATDGDELQAEDLTSGETIACDYTQFPNHFGFFLPLAGISTVKQIRDNPIDIQATSRLNRLYVELLRTNEVWATTERRHDMNQFMGRLIFCYFAEDTNIFNGDNLFTKTVEQMSDSKTDNTDYVLKELFRAMDTTFDDRASSNIPRWADAMPYVNGGLFAGTRDVPKFSRAARSYLLHAGNLNWKEINPDIFGSMIQAVADDEERSALGMHYTSVPNILKVLNPLFLDDLRKQLDEANDNSRKLLNLKKRITRIRVFDPACGSGNFLVIAYKEMRAIEFQVNQLRGETHLKSEIPLNNFRGIELREFPAEIARLALIIAEFQCDVLYRGQKDALKDFLPLDTKNWIVCGNALRLDWVSICPPTGTRVKHAAEDLFHTPLEQNEIDFENEGGETFICGNPPYAGLSSQHQEQKADLKSLFNEKTKYWKSFDYVMGWFWKAYDYMQLQPSAAAFVSTNSICQGQLVHMFWPLILKKHTQISFAHLSFRWSNLASSNAVVTVVIIGFSNISSNSKRLFEIMPDGHTTETEVPNINAYLVKSNNVYVNAINESPHDRPVMYWGNKPTDNGELIMSADEARKMILHDANVKKFLKPYYGSVEFIKSLPRVCIWVSDDEKVPASSIPSLQDRFKAVKDFRKASTAKETQRAHIFGHRFRQIQGRPGQKSIIIPIHSSETRPYLPVGLLSRGCIISNAAFAIYEAPLWNMALIASRIHLVWIANVCGKIKSDFRYSNTLGWNTFPIPKLTEKNKTDLIHCAEEILLAREANFPATVAELYNHDNMPENLRAAHNLNDETLERIYIGRRFKNDTERLEKLFQLYTKMTSIPTLNERVS
ncbi:DNA methyltransferase [Candidatus Levibacter sp. Uisw_134_01]|uniref:class I SAM-dependent DNA methyltransferase n=1 Tax=Candidatus Levibacter sp. Uisw_134_01 TaxID=3230999 RepID=UPI003D51D14E